MGSGQVLSGTRARAGLRASATGYLAQCLVIKLLARPSRAFHLHEI